MWIFGFFILLFILLTFKLGWIQIIQSSYYSQKALKQQTSDSMVSAVRGSILDCNGKELAVCATTHTVWVRPSEVNSNGENDAEIEGNARIQAASLAAILSMEDDEVYEIITSNKTLVRVKKYIDAELADAVRREKFVGIELVEDERRSYPYGTFASHVLGFTNDDNDGQNGLELYYNRYLSGINGRFITTKDKNRSSLIYGSSKYYSPQDGMSLVTTIDEGIQYIVEQRLDEYKEITGATRIMCIVMDPSDGAVKAMAQTNDYDPNDPRIPVLEEDKSGFYKLNDQEKLDYWYKMWRCFCISDTVEPGSTFKLMTTSIALDTGAARMGDRFYCSGSIKVADRTLKCWYYPRSHGSETLQQAVENSCNPVMVQLIQKIGLKNYYEGLDAFGLTAKSGVDYPGEASNIIYPSNRVGPVELATMAYGQGISVTPISLISAVSSLANGGYVMTPHFMKAMIDSEGNVVQEYEPEVKGVSVSAQTAQDMLSVMELVVKEGGAGSAKIPGYRVGGKTGTASKPTVGGYSETDFYSSFIGLAPVDDPKFVCLVVVDTPHGRIYGSQTAAPCAKSIMQDILQYLNIEPKYTEAELKALKSSKTTVPDVTEQNLENAAGILAGQNLNYVLSPALPVESGEILITDQFPKAGEELTKDSFVTLYYKIINQEDETGHESN